MFKIWFLCQEEDPSVAPTTTEGGAYQFNAAATIPQQGFSFWSPHVIFYCDTQIQTQRLGFKKNKKPWLLLITEIVD